MRSTKTPVLVDVLAGAAAGALGSYLMPYGMKLVARTQSDAAKKREKESSYGLSATALTAKRVLEPFGVEFDDKEAEKQGMLVHYGFGMVQGAVFGLLARRWRTKSVFAGLLYGAALWALIDEGLVPALGLAPKFRQFPLSTHLKALAAHLVYGASTELGWRSLDRAASAAIH